MLKDSGSLGRAVIYRRHSSIKGSEINSSYRTSGRKKSVSHSQIENGASQIDRRGLNGISPKPGTGGIETPSNIKT